MAGRRFASAFLQGGLIAAGGISVLIDVPLYTYITREKMKELKSLESRMIDADRRLKVVRALFDKKKNIPQSNRWEVKLETSTDKPLPVNPNIPILGHISFNENKNAPESKRWEARLDTNIDNPLTDDDDPKNTLFGRIDIREAQHAVEHRVWAKEMEDEISRTWEVRSLVLQDIAFRRGELYTFENQLPKTLYEFLEKKYLKNQ